ncbi:MAG TPA: ATP-binding protein [Gammaproteobacteria bacterium]
MAAPQEQGAVGVAFSSPRCEAAGAEGVAVYTRQHGSELQRKLSDGLALLFEAATGLLASDDPLAFLEQLFTRLAALLDLHVYVHYAVSADGTCLQLAASGGLSAAQREAMARLTFGQAPCGEVARSRLPLVLVDAPNVTAPGVEVIRGLGLSSYVCHPLVARGDLFGTLAFGSLTRKEITGESVALLRAVSDLVALGIARHRAERALRDADQRKDEFLATLAHELRNPLAPIRSAVDLMRAARGDEATTAAALGIMERQVRQLTRLVDDLLEVSRITRGRLELRKSRTELAAILDSALDQTAELIEEAGHELTVVLPPEPLVLDCDAIRLAQVLANLLSNAAKYTPPGGHIRLEVSAAANAITITVRDDGIGIPPDKLVHIFEMFEQVDRSLERGYKGLGLGLTLVKSLVEMHGGTVAARSAGPGAGSEFIVSLPVGAPGAGAPASAPGEACAPGEHGLRVLIVDDNQDAATLLAQLLELQGHQTLSAFDGPQALAAGAAFQPQVILLDIGLPQMNGYEVAQRVRKMPWGENVVLVAITGWGQEQDKRRAMAAGFAHHLVKPVSCAALEELLHRVRERLPAAPSAGAN